MRVIASAINTYYFRAYPTEAVGLDGATWGVVPHFNYFLRSASHSLADYKLVFIS